MADLSHANPTGRFSGLADTYARYRPGYPPALFDLLVSRCGLDPGSLVVDVGSGTGISARALAQRGVPVVGVEPNADMRAAAEAAASDGPLHYREGRAEATGLPDACADLVLAAQAFHWFEPDAALREFHRILKPRGWVALVWNERDETDPFTAAYGAIIRSSPDTAAVEGPRGTAGEALFAYPCFQGAERLTFTSEQPLDEDGLRGRAFSASYAPRDPDGVAAWTTALAELFGRWQRDGRVVLRYETSLFLALRQ
jgi:SAM-dependent methyltransferase